MSRFYRAYLAGAEENCPRCATRDRGAMPPTEQEAARPCALPLAMAYVPSQVFENLYEYAEGWHRGTIFADLDKPYEGGCCK